MSRTLFEHYGGFATVSRIVLDFYERVLDDDLVGPFFEDTDMRRLMDHQTKFVSSLMGGPAAYSDERLAEIHRHLTIADDHFDRIVLLLGESLGDHGVAPEHVADVTREFERRRPLIVTARAPA